MDLIKETIKEQYSEKRYGGGKKVNVCDCSQAIITNCGCL